MQEKKVISNIDDCTTFEEIAEIREGWYREYVRNGDNLKELLTGGYKEPAHFLLELIQNAEDVDASEVNIRLLDDCLIFSHNGIRNFDIDDIRSITGICKTTKKPEDNKIGRFGIGFKSVFSICETPRVYSMPYAFELQHIRVPHKIPMLNEYKKGTHFVLPFASDEKTITEIYDLLLKPIKELNTDSILFLRKIRKISWEAKGLKGYYKKEKTSFTCGDRTYFICEIKSNEKSPEKYLFFERALTGKEKLFIALAYRISDEDGKRSVIMEQGNTKLFVSFPMQGEDTTLRFKINGPYATTHTRDTLSEKYATDNAAIIDETILLYKDSLRVIKDLGLFDVIFLGLLPIDSSIIRSKIYNAFHEATVELFKAEAFLPTEKGSFAKPADAILVGSKELVELLTANDCRILFKGRSKWLNALITDTSKATKDIFHFLRDLLKIANIDLTAFARSLTDEFLTSKSDKWLICFYKLVSGSYAIKTIIEKNKIIRLESGYMVTPFTGDIPNAHLQREGMKPTAKSVKTIFCENKEALEFLEFMGITTSDIVDDIRDFVGELGKCKDEADYLLVMELIADAYNDKDTTDDKRRRIAAILQVECSILCEDENRENKKRHKPADAFYRHNGVEAIYKGIPHWYICDALVAKADMDGSFARFLSALGAHSSIRLVELGNKLPYDEREKLRNGARCTYEWGDGWQIDKIDAILATMTREKSIALWKAIDKFDVKYFSAKYGWSYSHATNSVPIKAYFIRTLQNARWIYTVDDLCVTPSEILYENALQIYPQSKVIENNLDFLPKLELPVDIQTKLEIIAGIPPEYLRRIADDYHRAQEENEEFNPIDIYECDIPTGQEAFINTRSGLNEDDLEDEEDKARSDNDETDGVKGKLDDFAEDFYGGSEDDDDDLPSIGDIDPKYVPRKDTSDEQKEVAEWSENYVLQRILRNEFETAGYTITDEADNSYTAEKDGEILTLTRRNDGKKNQRGFDISIKRDDEVIRWIEVKASKYDTNEFRMSASQWSFAKTLATRDGSDGNKYFVYFVPRAGTKQAGLSILQNPYQKWIISDTIEADPIGIRLVSVKK